MNLLAGFAPFIAFALVDRLVGPVTAIGAAALIALIRVLYDGLVLRRVPKLLDTGTAFLFVAMVAFWLVEHPAWTVWNVRLVADMGLLLLVVWSIAIGRPFTLPYAREHVDAALWDAPSFAVTNRVISEVWALALLVVVIADALMATTHADRRIGVGLIVAAVLAAMKFTQWYPRRRRRVLDRPMMG